MYPFSTFGRLGPLFAIITVLLGAGETFGQTPILSLQASTRILPLLSEALRDPKVLRNEVRDAVQASAIQREIAEYDSDLRRAKGARRLELHKLLMADYASLVAYYEDTLSGTLSREGNQVNPADLSRARAKLMQHAAKITTLTKRNTELSQARYLYYSQKYILGSGRSAAVSRLKNLKHLDPYLQRRRDLVVALHELDRRGTRINAQAQLRQLIRPLHTEGAIVARLALSRKLAGLNSRGKKYRRADRAYRAYAYQATKRARKLSPGHQQQVLSYALGIWRRAEPRADWSNPPVYLSAYKGTAQAHGLQERIAISQWRKQRYSRAAKGYLALAQAYSGQPIAGKLDQRILAIRQNEYQSSKKSRNYETALVRAKDKYKDKTVLGDASANQVASIARAVDQRYAKLVTGEVKLANSSRANQTKRREVIALLGRYKESLSDQAQRNKYEEITGDLLAKNQDHQQAVGVYLDLALNQKTGRSAALYSKAIASQRVLARWPAKAPWTGIRSTGKNVERTQLLNMYKRLATGGNAINWDAIAHQGLLEISLGDTPTAFKLWIAALQRSPQGYHAAQATGLMIEVHQRTKSWAKLEKVIRLALKKQITPSRGTKQYKLNGLLADALLYGGRQHLDAKAFDKASEKLSEFVKQFKQDKRHDEAQFYLAHAYRGQGQHNDAIKALVDLTKQHPRSSYYKSGLLKGGNWGIAMGLEEEVIYFHQRFIKRHASAKETPGFRENLIALYEGRQLIGQATQLLRDQATDKRLTKAQRLAAAERMLNLEIRYGGGERAMEASKLILGMTWATAEAKALALSYQATHYAGKKNVPKMKAIETQMTKLVGSKVVENALGKVRFQIALYIASVERDEIQNVALKDPLATLNREYKFYNGLKRNFEQVCAAGDSSYCAPAKLEISAQAQTSLERITEISMPDVLAKKTVDEFERRKRAVVATLERDHKAYVGQAYEVVKGGNTNPTYTEQVLWRNSNDWNFDRITGETGNGYIQFSPNLVIEE